MAYTGHHEATDDRDRVYALLGICSDTDRAIVGAPDYTCSAEELYTRTVVNFMRHHQSLNILCHGALFTAPRGPDMQDPGRGQLPTWVPDWRRWTYAASRPVPSMVSEPSRPEIGNFYSITDKEHGVADPNLVYAASAGLPAEFSVSEDSRRMTCKGIVIGIIDGLGPVGLRGPEGGLDGYSSQTLIQSTSDANTMRRGHGSDPEQQPVVNSAASYAILESFVRCLSLDRAGRYLMQPADVDGYVRELRDALLDPVSEGPQDGVGSFIEANKELSVREASLSEHLKMANTLPRGSETRGEHSFWQASEFTVGDRSWDCRLITTDQGHLGMAPRQAMKGDVVAVLIGCSVPVILRDTAGTEEYEVVGEAFMPGFMEGETIAGNKTPNHITLV